MKTVLIIGKEFLRFFWDEFVPAKDRSSEEFGLMDIPLALRLLVSSNAIHRMKLK
jgi:hypothetical protein